MQVVHFTQMSLTVACRFNVNYKWLIEPPKCRSVLIPVFDGQVVRTLNESTMPVQTRGDCSRKEVHTVFTAIVIISLEYTGLRKRPASALHAQHEARDEIPLRI